MLDTKIIKEIENKVERFDDEQMKSLLDVFLYHTNYNNPFTNVSCLRSFMLSLDIYPEVKMKSRFIRNVIVHTNNYKNLLTAVNMISNKESTENIIAHFNR